MARLIVISGLLDKAPACFLVETGGARLLLDLGDGPPPGRVPDTAAIGRVDAILLSHQHPDHLGALRLRPAIGDPPVHASDIVRRALPPDVPSRSLPLCGATTVCGVTVRTGRSGHAPGGVWLHLALGGGLLYMGDNCDHSILYASDPPPPAATVIVDASYGDYDKPFATSWDAIDRVAAAGPLLLPSVPAGRGPEIALHLARRGIMPALDDTIRTAIAGLAGGGADCLVAGTADELARLAQSAPSPERPEGVMVVAPATAAGGAAKALIDRWGGDRRLQIVFTGYLQPGSPAEALVTSGRASVIRWNIHPLLSDNAGLVRSMRARTVIPAFGGDKAVAAMKLAFAPARLAVENQAIEL